MSPGKIPTTWCSILISTNIIVGQALSMYLQLEPKVLAAVVVVTVEDVPPNTDDPVVDLFALKLNRDVPEEACVVEELLEATPN